MKTFLAVLCLSLLLASAPGFCETAVVDSGGGHFSYSVEGDWPFGNITGKNVELPEPTQVGEDTWALMIELKNHNMKDNDEGPSLYISIRGKEAPPPGGYPLSFGQESTNYTAMIIAQGQTLRIISGSGLLDIVASDKDKLEARFEFQPENEVSTVKNAVVKGSFLAVAPE
jgi:hypothetical protein